MIVAVLKWPVVLGLLGGLFWLAYQVHRGVRATETEPPPRASEKDKDAVLKFVDELAKAHGVEYSPAEAVTWQEQVPVYGRVVPNPAAMADVSSPINGILRRSPETASLAPGQKVRAGQMLGRVEVRIGPLEELDLQSKLAEARIKQQGAEEIRRRRRELVDRMAANPATVTRMQREDAEVQLAEAEMQLETARTVAGLWQQALEAIQQRNQSPHRVSTWSLPLTSPLDGEVVELVKQPDTTVAADGLVLRLADFRRCRVRLDFPPALLGEGPPEALELFAVSTAPSPGEAGTALRPVEAKRFGPASEADAASQFARYWYEVDFRAAKKEPAPELRDGVLWRPGLFVKALVKAPQATAQEAIAVPVGAVLFHQGRALVYVHVGPHRFARREVRILGRQGNRYLLAARDPLFELDKVGVKPGEQVVREQAQVLLSEEFRSVVDLD
jgi:multidrug efflux pump subunit AcrA (membrane-fusion protein)